MTWSYKMLQVRSILLRGKGVKDAQISFNHGANILAGESDTGKSYLVHCLDYIFGGDAMSKRIPEAESYSQLFVEFQNSDKNFFDS
jgi:DNA repair ATPase RecN